MKMLAILICVLCAESYAQQSAVFQSETKEVSIDAVVTGKKGEPVGDLSAKDFRVWEDNKEQTIRSFALSTDSTAEPRRLVLFFDDASLSPADEAATRQAAARFVDSNVSANRLMAIVTFDGAFRVAQSFTDNAGRLKDALAGVRLGEQNPNVMDPRRWRSSRSSLPLEANQSSVNARGLMEAVGYLAQNLNVVPGRKMIVLFSAPVSFSGLQPGDVAPLTRICNRSDVAVYPVVPTAVQDASDSPTGPVGLVRPGVPGPPSSSTEVQPDVPQGANIPFTLAKDTGGFVVPMSNDLPAELEKVATEQNQYYVLSYTPPDSKEGACHTLRVKVDRRHLDVRSRSSYCTGKPQDLLAESKVEQDLEKRAGEPGSSGKAAQEMQAPFFYVAGGVAKVHVAMEIPAAELKLEREKGKLHAEVNILGIASSPDGGVAARFSDVLERNFDSQQDADRFEARPLHYEKEFKIAPGRYNLAIVFGSGGTSLGKVETPLTIDAYQPGQFAMSGLALSREARPAAELGLEASLSDDVAPMIADGMQLIPSGSNIFAPGEHAFCYFEIYARSPLDPGATVRLRVLEAKTGAPKWEASAKLDAMPAGKSTLPVGLSIPITSLAPGSYQFEVTAMDGPGKTAKRMVDFEIR
jgi:VWFA-related protein